MNFDINASYGVLPAVQKAVADNCAAVLNPSSIHQGGQLARAAIETARTSLRRLIGDPKDARIVFTSGASESNNQALNLVCAEYLRDRSKERPVIITSRFEHVSLLETAKRLESYGVEVRYLNGEINAGTVLKAMDERVRLVSLMSANNETGQITDIAEIAQAIRQRYPKCLVHSDAVQSLGKQILNFNEFNADLLTFSGHKLGALPGVGALVVKSGIPEYGLILGGPQELRWRAGTENVLGIISFGVAAEQARQELPARIQSWTTARAVMQEALARFCPDVQLLFNDRSVLPHTFSLLVTGISADDLVVALDLRGIYVSSGSACASGKPLPSHVLLAAGLSENQARSVIRVSLPPFCSNDQLEYFVGSLREAISAMRATQIDYQEAV